MRGNAYRLPGLGTPGRKKNSESNEDDKKKAEKDLQDLLDKNIKKADAALAAKEKELMAI